jgi:hypothetical protein
VLWGTLGEFITWKKLVPRTEDFGLEELGRVVGCECLVNLEGCDLCWHYWKLVPPDIVSSVLHLTMW